MIVVVSDTHRTDRPALSGTLGDAVRRADRVIHAGDFITEAVLDGFQAVGGSVLAVHGNRDSPGVVDRLPAARTMNVHGIDIAITHTQRGGATGLNYFGAERDADLVISGHTHQSHVTDTGDRVLLNPGSHADPRGGVATYAVLQPAESGLKGAIQTTKGETHREFGVEGRSKNGGGSAGSGQGQRGRDADS